MSNLTNKVLINLAIGAGVATIATLLVRKLIAEKPVTIIETTDGDSYIVSEDENGSEVLEEFVAPYRNGDEKSVPEVEETPTEDTTLKYHIEAIDEEADENSVVS